MPRYDWLYDLMEKHRRLDDECHALRHDIARHVAICAEQATELAALRERVKKLEDRLLHHYDALSDWPLSEGHARDMCKRIVELFPDLFGAAAAGRG